MHSAHVLPVITSTFSGTLKPAGVLSIASLTSWQSSSFCSPEQNPDLKINMTSQSQAAGSWPLKVQGEGHWVDGGWAYGFEAEVRTTGSHPGIVTGDRNSGSNQRPLQEVVNRRSQHGESAGWHSELPTMPGYTESRQWI